MENLDTNIDTKVETGTETQVEDTQVDESNVDETKTEPKTITMTQDALDTLINKRLDRANKKAEEVKIEAERLAKMSEGERQQALFDADRASFAEEKKLYEQEKLELQVVKELSVKGLPTEFSKYLIGLDAETCMSNIKEFENQWQSSMEKAIDNKLRGNTPKSGTGAVTKNPWSTENFNLTEQGKIYRENPELAKTLMNYQK